MDKANLVDYFNPKKSRFTYTLPDGVQSLVFTKLNQGDRAQLESARDHAIFDRGNDSMEINLGLSSQIPMAIKLSLVDWSLKQKDGDDWIPVPFNEENVEIFVDNLDPVIVDEIEKLIVEHNSWLKAAPSKEEEDKLRKRLEKIVRERKAKEKK